MLSRTVFDASQERMEAIFLNSIILLCRFRVVKIAQ